MSILIRGMEMPTNCDDCSLDFDCPHNQSIDGYKMQGGRPRTCPLVYIPPHGRMIDADKIGLTDFEIILCQKGNPFKNALEMLLEKIENAPTIIPADESDMDSFIKILKD